MKKFAFVFKIFICFIILSCNSIAKNYTVNLPDNYTYSNKISSEKLLFILDYSASMTDKIKGKSKQLLMLETMQNILPQLNPSVNVGLRVYGHRAAITQIDGCKASSLLVPIRPNNSTNISNAMIKTKARGLTPITYSLKKAVDSDFFGYSGKKHIILLTDGGENCDESPCIWAMELVKYRKDVKIDVIAFNIDDKEDLDQLKCSALVTSGKFYSANTSGELINSLKNSLNIKKNVDAKIIPND